MGKYTLVYSYNGLVSNTKKEYIYASNSSRVNLTNIMWGIKSGIQKNSN